MRTTIFKPHWMTFWLLLALTAWGSVAVATDFDEPLTIEWSDLIPSGWEPQMQQNDLPINHDQEIDLSESSPAVPVVEDLNGKLVKLPGYIVPLDFESDSVREFLLVPFIGACIHVPPPPANQVVYGESKDAVRLGGLWDPVWITGLMETTTFRSDLAEAGYAMQVQKVEPYK